MKVAHERALAGAAILDDSIARLLLVELDEDGRRGTTAAAEGAGDHRVALPIRTPWRGSETILMRDPSTRTGGGS